MFTTKGLVTAILAKTGGTSAAGKEWEKQDFVIQYEGGNYPKFASFTVFNKPEIMANIKLNSEVEVSFSIDSREYKEKYFTNLMAFKVDVIGHQTNATAPFDSRQPISNNSDDKDDLPF